MLLVSLTSLSLVSCFGGSDNLKTSEVLLLETPVPEATIPVTEVVDPGTQVPVVLTETPTKVLPTPTVVLVVVPTVTPTAVPPTIIPTLAPTPTPISVLIPPTPTPMPPGPSEGQLTPDGQMIFRNGAWQLLNPLTPTITPTTIVTPTPTSVPQYSVVTSYQVAGTPDNLDFSSGPAVADSKLSFSSTYRFRGSGFPTVVQLWQRNGSTDAVTSDANDSDCFTQKPVAFYRLPPARGMKYDKSVESDYPWSYCINEYRFNPQNLTIPWINATSWNYDSQGVLETFIFEGSTTGLADAWAPPGKWVVVIFAGDIILSEIVIP